MNSNGLVEDKIENSDIFDLFSPGSSVFKFHQKHQMKNLGKDFQQEFPESTVLNLNDDVDKTVRNLKRSGIAAKKVIANSIAVKIGLEHFRLNR